MDRNQSPWIGTKCHSGPLEVFDAVISIIVVSQGISGEFSLSAAGCPTLPDPLQKRPK
jgi:hypothetical protein